VLVTATLVGCSESGQGVRRQICGQWIGSPASGDEAPWYINMTDAHQAKVLAWIDPHGPISLTNLQVSNDCDHGTTVMVSDHTVLRVQNEIKATDSGSVVVEVTPRQVGRATVTAVRDGAALSTLTFIVRRRL
jgi:hypothetical protein